MYLAGKRMHAALAGHRLLRGELRHPRLVGHDLAGLTVTGVVPVGKHLFTRFDDGRSLHSHFRMDGAWHLYRPGTRWRRAAHEARAVLETRTTWSCCPPTASTAWSGTSARTCSTRGGTTPAPPRPCAGSPHAASTRSGWRCWSSG